MIIKLSELVKRQILSEDSNGRRVFKDSFVTQEILVNTANIVTVRELDSSMRETLQNAGLTAKNFSSVFLNRGGVNSTEVIVLESPAEIMKKVEQKGLLHD